MTALKTYWWYPREGKNLGDELTKILLTELYQVPTEQARMEDAELISTGSLLNWMWDRDPVRNRKRRLSVVGSGFMHPNLVAERLEFLDVYSVRGYLSTTSLFTNASGNVALGDPGLLVSKLFTPTSRKPHKRYGVIPHFSKVDDPALRLRWDHLPSSVSIDFRTDNLASVMEEMAACDIILSQSLHGLIIADALGIPNVWLNDGPLHSGGSYKFFDYFSSIDRPFGKGIAPTDVITESLIESQVFELSRMRLCEIQHEIDDAFVRFFSDKGILFTQLGGHGNA